VNTLAKFPKKGAWVMVKQTIPVDIPVDPLSVYFAKPSLFKLGQVPAYKLPDPKKIDEFTSKALQEVSLLNPFGDNHFDYAQVKYNDEYKSALVYCLYADIETRFGKVRLRPDEYVVIPDEKLDEQGNTVIESGMAIRLEEAGRGHAFIRWYNDDQSANTTRSKKFNDALFYCRTRGLSYSTAIQLLTGMITSQSIFYLEMHWRYQDMFIRDYPQYIQKKRDYFVKNNIPLNEVLPGGTPEELNSLIADLPERVDMKPVATGKRQAFDSELIED